MSLLTVPARAAQKLRKQWHRWRFGLVARQARVIAPLAPGHLPFVMLSMVQSRDVDAYLVAAHSFARQVPPRRVVVVCDPSITDEDRAIIRASIPHVELVRAEDFRHTELPKGGCWERLQAMALYAQQAYVVQLDADTVTSGPLPEVVEAMASATAFTLGEEPDQQRMTHEQAKTLASAFIGAGSHVQDVAEYALVEARLSSPWYVRGCAAFFGLPPSAGLLDLCLEFSREMTRLNGARWLEWGSEQVTANYVAAHYTRFTVLPYPRYGTPSGNAPIPVLAHFVGSVRFTSAAYRKAARQALGRFLVSST